MYQVENLIQKPRVDFCSTVDFFNGHTGLERIANKPDALRVRRGEFAGQFLHIGLRLSAPPVETVAADAEPADFQTSQSLLQ